MVQEIKKRQKKRSHFCKTFFCFCTGGETRTPDTWFWRPVLYQLSYTRVSFASANIVIHSKIPTPAKKIISNRPIFVLPGHLF